MTLIAIIIGLGLIGCLAEYLYSMKGEKWDD